MKYRYFICDVFTPRPFSGNQLAVLPDAEGLNEVQMQQIAREFNFSETAFVFPPEQGQTRKVRIFTPTSELPFAGHPNLGTAFSLYLNGYLGEKQDSIRIVFEEKAGWVPVSIDLAKNGDWFLELESPEPLSLGEELSVESVCQALSLSAEEIEIQNHHPKVASVGLPFLMVEVRSIEALQKARSVMDFSKQLHAQGLPFIHLYLRSGDEFDLRSRMFAPFDGVTEDPATGSANSALAGLLSELKEEEEGEFSWKILQGVEMGRPSTLFARAKKVEGKTTKTWIGGNCVQIAEGMLQIPVSYTHLTLPTMWYV